MTVINKMCFTLVAVMCLIAIFTLNTQVVEASSVKNTVQSIGSGTNVSAGSFVDVIKNVLGLLRLLTGLLSIIVIAYTGFEMVTETPEGKKKVKEKMVPIVGGVVLVFMATTIATFIVSVFE